MGALELIGFTNGSLDAYSCAIYIRWLMKMNSLKEDDRYHVLIVCGKSRVTPVKCTTIPRSELSGFLILSRLLKVVINAMDEKPYQINSS